MNSLSYDNTFAECRTTILKSIESSQVFCQPFPHLLFENIFPQAVYQKLLASFPPRENYAEFGKYAGTEVHTRFHCGLSTKNLAGVSEDHKILWIAVRDALGHPSVKECLFGQLSEGLQYRYSISRSDTEAVEAYPKTELFHETSGYSIKPHPDTRKKVVTMQIALPVDDSQADLGTEFYRLNPLQLFSKPIGFTPVMTTPFRPNCGYAFVVLNTKFKRSWHGRSQLGEQSGVRNSLLHLYYGDPANADQEVYEKFYAPSAEKLQHAA